MSGFGDTTLFEAPQRTDAFMTHSGSHSSHSRFVPFHRRAWQRRTCTVASRLKTSSERGV